MGDTGYTADEEKFDSKNGDDAITSHTPCDNGSNAVSGYKKLVFLLLAFVFILCFRANLIDRVMVSGNSMNPSFSDGDVMWARKFNIAGLTRYQVIVADIDGKLFIKRVIGLPNESLQIIDGHVYVNGIKLEDDYGYPTTVYGCAAEEISLGTDEYFLMGDNRDNSGDSREWGAVNIENITGVVSFRFFPFWKIGVVE